MCPIQKYLKMREITWNNSYKIIKIFGNNNQFLNFLQTTLKFLV